MLIMGVLQSWAFMVCLIAAAVLGTMLLAEFMDWLAGDAAVAESDLSENLVELYLVPDITSTQSQNAETFLVERDLP